MTRTRLLVSSAVLASFPALCIAEEPYRITLPDSPYTFPKSWVEIRETDEPGADAEVEFMNRDVNGPYDNGDYVLEWGGLQTMFHFEWQGNGPDSVYLTPPIGYVCVPTCDLTIPEKTSIVVYLMMALS